VTVDTAEAAAPVVDTARPWPGLDAFTEAQSPFFFGRDAEADELFRRVRRDVTTLLFGQSGLGKTSLLQAGLFPRLRWADFLPILIRLDHSPGAPPPAAQIKTAIERGVAAADLSEVTPIGAEESLWGYFHRADRRLADYAGKEIVPVLVFDQFEEVFTQGLAGEERRATSQDFLSELAELVENRPPEALERAIDADPDLVESFSFDRQDYRIVLALREDFLASLDSLRSRAPSLGRNRYRLRRMSGRQGLDAILNPAPGLVAPEVAQEIIRFIGRPSAEDAFGIAGDAAEGFEVEPPLLSLVCRELNERRIARRLDQIGADLLAGSRDEIIEGFYDRCLADQPEALRAFVEDRLLSDSGYRESVTLDSARRALSDAGVPAGALDELVRRRLLRTEERLGIPRVEIIHDVLTPVIRKSRDSRRLRQAEAAAAEREAALYRERQRVRRAYWLSEAMALLAIITIGVAWWGWSSKLEAERQRAVAEEQRAAAAGQSKRAEENFDMAVTTADSMVTTAAERLRGQTGVSTTTIKEILASAELAFDQLAAVAPSSRHLRWRQAIMLLSFTYTYQALGDSTEALRRAKASADLMEALASENPQNDQWAATLADSARAIGDALCDSVDSCESNLAEALAPYRRDLQIMTRLSEKDRENSDWQYGLARAHTRIGQVLSEQGDLPAALTEYRDDLSISQHLVDRDPGNAQWQRDLVEVHYNIGDMLIRQGDPAHALVEYGAGLDIALRLTDKNSNNADWQYELAVGHSKLGDVHLAQDSYVAALAEQRASLDIIRHLAENDPENAKRQRDLAICHFKLGDVHLAQGKGNPAGALTEYRTGLEVTQRLVDKDKSNAGWQRELAMGHERLGNVSGDMSDALAEYHVALDIRQRLAENDPRNVRWQSDLLRSYAKIGALSLQRNDFPAALGAFERAEKIALHMKEISPTAASSTQDLSWVQDRLEETRQKIAAPAVAGKGKK
jgi:tetratricopeptide (TPR) repeat protein